MRSPKPAATSTGCVYQKYSQRVNCGHSRLCGKFGTDTGAVALELDAPANHSGN